MTLTRHFVNLTNGIEAIPSIDGGYSFIRLQSTACEQKRWDFILQDLDYDFLMHLALGYACVVHDFGAHKKVPRAAYQGLAWVEYALNRRWFGIDGKVSVRGNDATRYFQQVYAALEDRTLRKLDYFKKFLVADSITLLYRTDQTEHDGHYQWYCATLETA